MASNTARAATASAPSHVLGVAPSLASAAKAVRAASCTRLSRCTPKVAGTDTAMSRARSSAAPRDAPTIRTGLPGEQRLTATRAYASRSAADGDTSTWKRPRSGAEDEGEDSNGSVAIAYLLSRTSCRVTGYDSTALPSDRECNTEGQGSGIRAQGSAQGSGRLRGLSSRVTRRSGRESRPDPETVSLLAILDAVVKAAWSALPELELVGDHAVARPTSAAVGRYRRRSGEPPHNGNRAPAGFRRGHSGATRTRSSGFRAGVWRNTRPIRRHWSSPRSRRFVPAVLPYATETGGSRALFARSRAPFGSNNS